MIHLDTSFLIRAFVVGTGEEELLRGWLAGGEELRMCAVAWGELLCGPLSAPQTALAKRVVARRIDVTEEHAALAAELFNKGGRRRGSFADCLIAAAALGDDAALATSNAADFERFAPHGLRVLAP